MSKLTFARNESGEFEFSESKLAKLNAALIERASEPRVPVSMKDAASRELVSAVNRTADARRISFSQAAHTVVCERPQLFKLTTFLTVHDGAGDVEISE